MVFMDLNCSYLAAVSPIGKHGPSSGRRLDPALFGVFAIWTWRRDCTCTGADSVCRRVGAAETKEASRLRSLQSTSEPRSHGTTLNPVPSRLLAAGPYWAFGSLNGFHFAVVNVCFFGIGKRGSRISASTLAYPFLLVLASPT